MCGSTAHITWVANREFSKAKAKSSKLKPISFFPVVSRRGKKISCGDSFFSVASREKNESPHEIFSPRRDTTGIKEIGLSFELLALALALENSRFETQVI